VEVGRIPLSPLPPLGTAGGGGQRAGGGARSPLLPGGGSVTDDDPATEAQRSNLRRSMMQAGMLAPNDPKQAHHIVPGGGPMSGGRDPGLTQRQLARLGIGLDTPENGAPLSPGFHQGLHTAAYYDYVQRQLEGAQTAESARTILHAIRS
jgi:hypothetical protein